MWVRLLKSALFHVRRGSWSGIVALGGPVLDVVTDCRGHHNVLGEFNGETQ